MRDDYLSIYSKAQAMKRKWRDGWAYDYRRIREIPELAKYYVDDLPRFLSKLKRAIEKNYLRVLSLKCHRLSFVMAKDYFGNLKGRRGPNAFFEELEHLYLNGDHWKPHKGELCRNYHIKVAYLECFIDDAWKMIQEKFGRFSPKELEAWRKLESLWDSIPPKRQKQQTARRGDITQAEYKRKFGYYPSP